ncbi:MAG TPA: hypothetical protein VFQ35_07715 [Polyangiaceae bacterium]|nr:hypothetical protein [Polyangiaceae bacterium]
MLRAALTGGTLGAVVSLAAAGAAWALYVGPPRLFTLLACGAGALVGAAWGVRQRWSHVNVALFLDARLGESELVTSALDRANDADPVANALRERAARSLHAFSAQRLDLSPFSRWHALMLPALGLAAWVSVLPARVAVAASPPGAKLLQRKNVPGLERIEALSNAPSLSDSDAERLKRLAEEARRLRSELGKGLSQREAQARIAALRESIGKERERFGDRTERPGLEAAIGALEAETTTKNLAKALGDGDLVTFDEEMQRIANLAESESRKAAERALEEAARVAREKAAKKLSDYLDRKRKDFREREANARTLREFAKELESKLSPEARSDLKQFEQSGDPEAARRLAEALGKALKGLSEEERQKLADALKNKMNEHGEDVSEMSPEEMRRLVDSLKSAEGQKKLEDALRDLAKKGADSERDRALDDAERGGAEAERSLGGNPTPMPMPGSGDSSANGGPKGREGTGKDDARSKGPGQNGDGPGGPAKHDGTTDKLDSNELRARANARWLPGAPLAARSLGRAPGRAGETANQVGVGNLSSRASSEVGAVERGDIPEEYREQVGRYFEP